MNIKLNKIENDITYCVECIKHWTENSLGLTSNKSPDSCAFCNIYRYNSRAPACDGCPIYEKTGKTSCRGTPYEQFDHIHDFFAPSDKNSKITKFQEYSTDEVLFLSELLNDLIKKKNELKKEINNKIQVGDYITIKSGIKKKDVWNVWPETENFPGTIFKVREIHNDKFYTQGYISFDENQIDYCSYRFLISQFEKIDVKIEPGIMVANIENYKKYNVKELNVKYNDKTFVICKELNSGELVAFEEEKLIIIKL